MVAQHFGAHRHGQRKAEEEAQPQQPQAQRAQSAGEQVEQCPAQPVGEDEADVAPWARVADGARPAQLVIDVAAPGVGRDAGLDDFLTQCHAVARLGYARAEFVIVGQMVDQDLQAADFLECLATDSQRRAEAVAQAALNPFGKQDASLEIRGDAEGFKAGWKGSVGAAAIKSGDEADLLRVVRMGLRAF